MFQLVFDISHIFPHGFVAAALWWLQARTATTPSTNNSINPNDAINKQEAALSNIQTSKKYSDVVIKKTKMAVND